MLFYEYEHDARIKKTIRLANPLLRYEVRNNADLLSFNILNGCGVASHATKYRSIRNEPLNAVVVMGRIICQYCCVICDWFPCRVRTC